MARLTRVPHIDSFAHRSEETTRRHGIELQLRWQLHENHAELLAQASNLFRKLSEHIRASSKRTLVRECLRRLDRESEALRNALRPASVRLRTMVAIERAVDLDRTQALCVSFEVRTLSWKLRLISRRNRPPRYADEQLRRPTFRRRPRTRLLSSRLACHNRANSRSCHAVPLATALAVQQITPERARI